MGEAAASPQSFRMCKVQSNIDEQLPRMKHGPYFSASQGGEPRGDPVGARAADQSIKGRLQALSPVSRVLQVKDPICFYSYLKIINISSQWSK